MFGGTNARRVPRLRFVEKPPARWMCPVVHVYCGPIQNRNATRAQLLSLFRVFVHWRERVCACVRVCLVGLTLLARSFMHFCVACDLLGGDNWDGCILFHAVLHFVCFIRQC